MKTFKTFQLFAVAAVITTFATVANADQKYLFIPDNNSGHHCPNDNLPKLGFWGYQSCHGMVVTKVRRGTEAWKIGLEPGDVIVSIDGYRLTHNGDYERALRMAGNVAILRIKDVRGRGVFTVKAQLYDSFNRPVVEYRMHRD